MKAALIGAGPESLHTIQKAQELGVFVTALDGNPAAEGLTVAQEGLTVDISEEEAVLSALRERKPDFLITGPIGRYLTTAGAVNDALGLRGVSREAAVLCTDKYLFHQKLTERGLRDCQCFLIPGSCLGAGTEKMGNMGKIMKEVSGKLRYPAILKPRYGSGSRGIFFLKNAGELAAALAALGMGTQKAPKESAEGGPDTDAVKEEAAPAEDLVLEEAVHGVEYGVDGAMDGPAFQMILLRKKLLTPPPARQAVGYLSVIEDSAQAGELIGQVRGHLAQVAAVLGLKDCLLHADLMISGKKIFVIELSARPSGHDLHDRFTPMATGVDMAESYIRSQMGIPYSYYPIKTERLLIRYFDLKPGVVKRVPEENELSLPAGIVLRSWKCNIRPGDRLGPVTTGHSLMGRGNFILGGGTEEELTAAAEHIERQFEVE